MIFVHNLTFVGDAVGFFDGLVVGSGVIGLAVGEPVGFFACDTIFVREL